MDFRSAARSNIVCQDCIYIYIFPAIDYKLVDTSFPITITLLQRGWEQFHIHPHQKLIGWFQIFVKRAISNRLPTLTQIVGAFFNVVAVGYLMGLRPRSHKKFQINSTQRLEMLLA